jgi:hypothetical protein
MTRWIAALFLTLCAARAGADPVAQRFSAAKKGLAGLKPCATLAPIHPGYQTSEATAPAERILVMPFENLKREGRIFWLTEASAVLLTDDLGALGTNAISRSERQQAFEQLQVPHVASLTDATLIRIGQIVGAAQVVVGSLQLENDVLVMRASHCARHRTRARGRHRPGPLSELFATFERIARRIAPPSTKSEDIERAPADRRSRLHQELLAETPATAITA